MKSEIIMAGLFWNIFYLCLMYIETYHEILSLIAGHCSIIIGPIFINDCGTIQYEPILVIFLYVSSVFLGAVSLILGLIIFTILERSREIPQILVKVNVLVCLAAATVFFLMYFTVWTLVIGHSFEIVHETSWLPLFGIVFGYLNVSLSYF